MTASNVALNERSHRHNHAVVVLVVGVGAAQTQFRTYVTVDLS